MKNLIFILLFAPLFSLGQQLKTQPVGLGILSDWKTYLAECNELVPDTVIQSGTVNVEYKPVMSDGKITHFILAPIDTVWQKVECLNYKEPDGYHLRSYGDIGISSWNSNYTLVSSNYAVMTIPAPTYTTLETKSKITITRKKICQIKKRQASWEDFWNRYCKEKKIIEFN